MTRNLENSDVPSELQNASLSQEKIQAQAEARVQSVRDENRSSEPRRLAAGDWLRAVMGFSAPFGHDGMPTVWG